MTHAALTKYLELGPEKNKHTRKRDRFSSEWLTAGLSDKTPSDCPLDLNGPFPWDDNRFDLVYSSHVMEHLADALFFLCECLRVVKPGGVVRIAVPSMPWIIKRYIQNKTTLDDVLDWARCFQPLKHRDGYDGQKLVALFDAAGFEYASVLMPERSNSEIMKDSYFSNRAERTIRCEGKKPCQK